MQEHPELTGPLWAWLDGQDTGRMNRYREYLAFYQGEQWNERRRAGETRLTVNYARALVRKVASYLMPRPVTFNVVDSPIAGSPPDAEALESALMAVVTDATGGVERRDRAARAEQLLRAVYAANDLHALDFQTAVDAAVLGDGAFKVTWDPLRAAVAVSSVDPQQLWAWWRADNPREVERVVQRYELDARAAAKLFGGEVMPEATRVKVVEDWRRDRYRVEVDGRVARDAENPYGWIPYVIFPNNARPHEFWGSSDLEDLVQVCRELNRRMTTVSRILAVAGYPITVLENVTGSEGIRVDAGAVWELPEASRAYLLDMLQGGGVRLHIDYIDLLYRQLHDLSETPRTAFGDSGRALSGVALEVEIQPLVQKVMRKRRTWDSVYRQRNAMILQVLEQFGGHDLGGLRQTETVWGEILPSDREAIARAETQLVAAHIHSRRDAMSTLGDLDAEETWGRILGELRELDDIGEAPSP